MWWKAILAKYAIIFVLGSFGSFIFLVTFAQNVTGPILPGDILIKQPEFVVFLPFSTSLILGLSSCITVEIYYFILNQKWRR